MKAPDKITIKAVERAIGLKAGSWNGKCFEIASGIVAKGLVEGRAVYGHWRGPVHPRSKFAVASTAGFVRHGWVLLPDGRVLDPTRWAFEHVAPYLYLGDADHYDEGGNKLRAAMRGPVPVYDPDDKIFHISQAVMDSATWTFVEKTLRLDCFYPEQEPGEMTLGQLQYLAHLTPDELGAFGFSVYSALGKLDLLALVPCDNLAAVEAKAGKEVRA
jgi:hypothetical protein